MQVIHDIKQWQISRSKVSRDQSIGFVATMGALHAGHGSLINTCKKENTLTVVSIFVNPTQFNKQDDFANYPNTMEKDLEYLQKLKVDFCLIPEPKDVYADGFQFQVEEKNEGLRMEGKHRPGHFTGVLTVVLKLLNLVKPHRAYFGEKDYQQYLLIRNMAQAFFMDIDIISCPIKREPSNLALSSRNARLSKAQHSIANEFARIFHQNLPIHELKKLLDDLDINVEYLEEHEGRRFAAVQIGDIRLIDNYLIS